MKKIRKKETKINGGKIGITWKQTFVFWKHGNKLISIVSGRLCVVFSKKYDDSFQHRRCGVCYRNEPIDIQSVERKQETKNWLFPKHTCIGGASVCVTRVPPARTTSLRIERRIITVCVDIAHGAIGALEYVLI